MSTMELIKIPTDGNQPSLEFNGSLLGEASTFLPTIGDKPRLRWHELKIYRTEAGKYIVAKFGMSRVYHAFDADCAAESMEKVTALDLFQRVVVEWDQGEYFYSCPECRPGSIYDDEDLADDAIVRLEVPRVSTHVCETADALVRALYTADKGGTRYLTHTAREAASMITQDIDPALYAAYNVQRVD